MVNIIRFVVQNAVCFFAITVKMCSFLSTKIWHWKRVFNKIFPENIMFIFSKSEREKSYQNRSSFKL